MKNKVCCFIGHRQINKSTELREKLIALIEDLIINKKVDKFFFGSKSKFDDYCYEIVTALKEVCLNIMKTLTSLSIWQRQAELLMWNETKK